MQEEPVRRALQRALLPRECDRPQRWTIIAGGRRKPHFVARGCPGQPDPRPVSRECGLASGSLDDRNGSLRFGGKQSGALEERDPARIRRHAKRPRSAGLMDDVAGRELHRPRTATAGVSNHGKGVGAWNPIGVHDAIEQVATGTARHRDPAERARAECSIDVLRTEDHGHVTRAGNGQDLSRLQGQVPRIRAAWPAEKHFVRLPVPAGAVDEALAIRREPRGRHVAVPERQAHVFAGGRRDRH